MKCLGLLAVAVSAGLGPTMIRAAENPVKVLIITGANNHDWKLTTEALKKIYEDSGRFTVAVTEKPSELTAVELAKYDVLVNNWTMVGKTGHVWSVEVEKAVEDFVAGGKGFVTFHAGSSCFADWPGFHKIAGGTWGKGTGHGKYHSFMVKMSEVDHPVTKGIADFEISDELWHKVVVLEPTPGRKVLCRSMSDKETGGTGSMEDVVICTEFGQGRGFYNTLGHDVKAMDNQGWRQLMLRGTEWAATGSVVEKPSAPGDKVAAAGFSWKQTDKSIALLNNGKVVWQLNHDKAEGKPYFHPLASVDGDVLTWLRPEDHPWHRALWFSWKHINGLNYWEEDKKTGKSDGCTELVDVTIIPEDDFSARIEMKLSYHPPDKEVLLAESRVIDVSAPREDGSYRLIWVSTFTALSDVLLGRTPIPGESNGVGYGGYAGLSIRMAKDTRDLKFVDSEGRQDEAVHGNKAAWLDASGDFGHGMCGVAIISPASNERSPSQWYLAKGMPYFSPAFLFSGDYKLEKGKPLVLRYSVLVHRGVADKAMLDNECQNFANVEKRRHT